MIELAGLNKHFGQHHVLKNINLSINKGDIFGIIGRSGAGKSTLLRAINLLERPDTGSVNVDNHNLMTLAPQALREARHDIGMIFQHFNLLDAKTVFENIALPLRIQQETEAKIQSRVKELLALVELSDKATAYPKDLSGGQKQRVAIARALSSSPKVLLCDEATSALDPETTTAILELLRKINQTLGITIVLITHEMDVIKELAHHVAFMSDGEITEIVTLNELFVPPITPGKQKLCTQLSPELPQSLVRNMTQEKTSKRLLRIYFQNDVATGPMVSHMSRKLNLDVNILLANIDRLDGLACGVMVVDIEAEDHQFEKFLGYCEQHNLIVESLGYVTNDVI